jgi:glycosyltransferase involved in cell wall biosynthesis
MPLVSIVTPSFNQGKFIRTAIEGVLHQSGVSLEYLVIDGGSSDETLEILQSYGSRLHWISEPDKGQADAINKGFGKTLGEILGWLNSDDLYCPGALRYVVQEFENDPNLMLLYGKAHHVDVNGHFLEEYPTTEFSLEALSYSCFICQPACFFRRSLFKAVGGLNPSLHYALDLDLWIRFGKLQQKNPQWVFKFLPEVLAQSRMHGESKTLACRYVAYREIIQVVKKHFDHVPFNWVYGEQETAGDRLDGYFQRSPFRFPLWLRSLARWLWHNRHDPSYVFRIFQQCLVSPRQSYSRIAHRVRNRFSTLPTR